jgi:heptosyltransferase-2
MPARPLIVRLRNWVGDVVLGIPALRRLQQQGFDLQLVGRRWAASLLEGEGWTVHVQPPRLRQRVAQLRQLRRQARIADPGFDRRLNALIFPFSFSSALEMRLAGLRAVGYAHEGRGLLLADSVTMARSGHELSRYWALAGRLDLGRSTTPPPDRIGMRVSRAAQDAADRRLREAGITGDFLMLCPFAGGTFEGQDKRWPEFGRLIECLRLDPGWPLVACPGPGEFEAARRDLPGVTVLADIGLGEYAALLRRSRLMVSNDTGPGHIAAALDVPLISVLGPTDPAQWGPWGPSARIVRGVPLWPGVAEVHAAVRAAIGEPAALPRQGLEAAG